ncbi:MAG: hypothetical protein MUD14_09480, partial [Hydrococcus sp. Prado102]|nr:hypothetical protein [Hydrococcus sp. Prado102]
KTQVLTYASQWPPEGEQQTLLKQLRRKGAGDISFLCPEGFTPSQPIFSFQDESDSLELTQESTSGSLASAVQLSHAKEELRSQEDVKNSLLREKKLVQDKIQDLHSKLRRVQESFLKRQKSANKKEILLKGFYSILLMI